MKWWLTLPQLSTASTIRLASLTSLHQSGLCFSAENQHVNLWWLETGALTWDNMSRSNFCWTSLLTSVWAAQLCTSSAAQCARRQRVKETWKGASHVFLFSASVINIVYIPFVGDSYFFSTSESLTFVGRMFVQGATALLAPAWSRLAPLTQFLSEND